MNSPDVIAKGWAIEAKYMKKPSLRKADLQQAETNARGMPWALAIMEAGTSNRWVILTYEQFVKLVNNG